MFAIKKLDPYLYGSQFTIYTVYSVYYIYVAERTSNLHSTLLSYNNITSGDRMLWDSQPHQLDDHDIPDDLEMSVPRRPHTSCRPRGLLNVFGLISKSLFGTATQEDVDILKNAVAESCTNMANLFHNQEQLLTVYNKTRNLLKSNFIDVQALQGITQRLSSNVKAVNKEISRFSPMLRIILFLSGKWTLVFKEWLMC